MSQVNVVKIYRTLTEAQQQRINDHAASVVQLPDGSLQTKVNTIITPQGNEKENKVVSVVPSPEEKVYTFDEAQALYRDLGHMNVMLTNACNLSCSYCYEQHNKDFGRFTVESLKKAYDWLRDINKKPLKVMQFFGGEPLIHKKLISDFVKKHHDEIDKQWQGYSGTGLSVCTNGLLLDDEFIDLYFNKRYTHMLISLDTTDLEKDYREITQEQLDTIISNVEKITKIPNVGARLTIRCTLSEETAATLGDFIDLLYSKGVKRLIVHPLVLDSRRGYIEWDPANWELMRNHLFNCLDKYHDLTVLFSEGVGEKQDNNCMVGSDMIAIDASGDYSGCYFFTNHKAGIATSTILGNIYDNRVYVDRYKQFQRAYDDMFITEEQCKTCDYNNMCYQCPAGNLDTGSQLFRPDGMCQKIVKLYLDLQSDVAKKQFQRMYELRLNQMAADGEQQTIASGAHILNHFLKTGERLNFEVCSKTKYKPYKEILGDVWTTISGKDTPTLDIRDLYINLCKHYNIPVKTIDDDTPAIRIFYLQMISTLILERK